MAIRGQRFELDLSDDADNFTFNPLDSDGEASEPETGGLMIGEIKERDTSAPPAPPKFRSTATGFPAHRKRTPSKFKQAQTNPESHRDHASLAQNAVQRGPSDQAIAQRLRQKKGISAEDIEKKQIDEENRNRLASMSVEEIEEARRELLGSLNPTMLERLLRRANIDDHTPFDTPPSQPLNTSSQPTEPSPEQPTKDPTPSPLQPPKKSVSFAEPSNDRPSPPSPPSNNTHPQTLRPDDAEPTANQPSMHFPAPPRDPSSMPTLDPLSSSFLTDLQTHYFPNTPHDPGSLSWLTDPSASELASSPYSPTSTSSIPVSALRFSFTGALLPPSMSSAIDVREGLHHHGLDPDSAGYTIPELSMLARSTVPGQKCIAFMVLGRILYRLGSGGFGAQRTELVEGLWECVEGERGLEVMIGEANREEGKDRVHRSVMTYATEGVWLWRQGLEKGGVKQDRGLHR